MFFITLLAPVCRCQGTDLRLNSQQLDQLNDMGTPKYKVL